MTFPIKQSRPAEKHKGDTCGLEHAYPTKGQSRHEKWSACCEKVCGHFRQGDFFHLTLSLICHWSVRKAYAIRHPNHILPSGGTVQIAFREHSTVRAHHTGAALLSIISFHSREEKKILYWSRLKQTLALAKLHRPLSCTTISGGTIESIRIIMGHLKQLMHFLCYGCVWTC